MEREVSLEELKNKTNLSQDDLAAVEKEAYEEFYADEDKPADKRTEEEEEEAGDVEEPEEKSGEEEEEEEKPEEKPAEKTEEEKAAEAKKLLEEALKKPESERTDEEKSAVAAREKAEKEASDKRVKEFAAANKISEDDARKEIESYGRIAEKYKRDPEQMAKALLYSQREFQKLKEQQEKAHQAQVEASLEIKEGDEMVIGGKKVSWEEASPKIVEAYRKREPKLTEDMDDEQVARLALKDINKFRQDVHKKRLEEVSQKASQKRDEILSSLEIDEKFIPDIKGVLDQTEDAAVLDERFDIAETIAWAKGKHYDADLKAAEERGYKKGLEQSKILGEKSGSTPISSGKPAASNTAKGWSSLSKADQQRAMDMFDGTGMTEQEMFEAFTEIYEDKPQDSGKKKK